MNSNPNQAKGQDILTPKYRPEGDALSGVDRLLAINEIRLTKARYCAAVDDHDWDALRTVFTEDCEMDWPLPGHDVQTAGEFVTTLASMMPTGVDSRHHVHNLQVEFTSPTEAIVRWDHENWAWIEHAEVPNMVQWGQYRERYRKTDSGWLISYFSEQYLYNSPASNKRRRAGIGDGGVD